MTGSDAWKIIAPIIGKFCDRLGVFDDAYITTFVALKQYDERQNKKDDEDD